MKSAAFFLVLLLLVTPSFAVQSDADGGGSLVLSTVIPTGSFEGVTITNYGGEADLSDYHLSDGEGTVTFSSRTIGSGCSVSVLKEEPADWFPAGETIVFGDGAVCKGFALNDSGDDIYLMRGDEVIDAFVYGSGTLELDGWVGEPFVKIPKSRYASRVSLQDTDTCSDWIVDVPGRTHLSSVKDGFPADVTPFVFPDSCGDPIFDALSGAEDSVSISVYILSHPKVVSYLQSLLVRGIEVRILSEGTPAGGIPEEEISAFAALVRAGADVRFISVDDGFKRYTYLHNKYAVIDSDTVVITSENWVESSFTSNRGWGAVISSPEYAEYMLSVFDNDYSDTYADIDSFREKYPTAQPGTYRAYRHSDVGYESFRALVRPVLSPDNSYDSLRHLISSSKSRVYSEQLDVQYSWIYETDTPVSWMTDAGRRGADSRLIVDVTFDDPNDSDYQDGYGVLTMLDGQDGIIVKCNSASSNLCHNKGVIADDEVWLGSVNWTYNSFLNNREAAVIIDSPQISDYYASYFLEDWGSRYIGEVVPEVSFSCTEPEDGRPFVIDASETITSDGSIFEWDIDGDGIADRSGEKILMRFSAGIHSVTLVVIEMNGTEHRMSFDICVKGSDPLGGLPEIAKYVPLLIICATILGVNCIREYRGKKNAGKGVQRRGRR